MCLDSDVAPEPGNCIIYSFGVGEEMTFDQKMAAYNCSIYAFDMTLVNKTSRVLQHGLHLVLVGLNNENFDVSFKIFLSYRKLLK